MQPGEDPLRVPSRGILDLKQCKTKKQKKNHKTKNKTKKRCYDPSNKKPTKPRSIQHVQVARGTAQRSEGAVGRAPSPGERPGLACPGLCWREAPLPRSAGSAGGKGPLLYQVFLSSPPLPGHAGPHGGTGPGVSGGEPPAGLDLCCQLCQWRGPLG